MGICKVLWGFVYFLIVGFVATEENIRIYPKLTGKNQYAIVCEAWGPHINSTSVHLNCPLIGSKICYMNCEAPCVMEDDLCQIPASLRPIVRCTSSRLAYNRVRYEYLLDNRLIKHSGNWSCTYRGQNTKKLLIDKYEYVKPSASPKEKQTPNKPNYDYNNFVPPKNDIMKNNYPRDESGTNSGYNYDSSRVNSRYDTSQDYSRGLFDASMKRKPVENYPDSFTDPKLVIGLLIMLVVSLIVNIIFCLRCILFRYYIGCNEDNRRGKQPCLADLLCLGSHKDPNFHHNAPHVASSRQDSSVYEDLNGFGSHRRVARQPPSAITQVETIVDDNGIHYPVRYPMVQNGIPASPVPSNRSTSMGHPVYYKMPPHYYQNGYGAITPPAGNYVYMASHPLATMTPKSQHTIYDDVPFELRPHSNRIESRQGSQYPDSEMNRSILQEEEEMNPNLDFPPPPLEALPPNLDNQTSQQPRHQSLETVEPSLLQCSTNIAPTNQ